MKKYLLLGAFLAVSIMPLVGHAAQIISVQSWGNHGSSGSPLLPLPIDLDINYSPTGTTTISNVESRSSGLSKLIYKTDGSLGAFIGATSPVVAANVVTGEVRQGYGVVIANDAVQAYFSPALPDQACYAINLGSFFNGLIGHKILTVAALKGDVTNNGVVTVTDMLATKDKVTSLNSPVDYTTARYDINNSGNITVTDMLYVKSLIGHQVNCGGPTNNQSALLLTRLSPSSPLSRVVNTSPINITKDVVLGVFGLKVQNQNATINSLNFNLNNSKGVATTTLYSNVRLDDSNGNLPAGANSLSGGSPTFANLAIPLTQDVWTDLILKADVQSGQTDISASSTLVGGVAIVGTDVNYNSLNVSTAANQTSADIQYSTSPLIVNDQVATVGDCASDTPNQPYNRCALAMSFTLNNLGSNDVFVSTNPGLALATSSSPFTASTTLTVANATPATLVGDTSSAYIIPAGIVRKFTYNGTFSGNGGVPSFETFRITGISYGDNSTNLTSHVINSGLDSLYVSKTLAVSPSLLQQLANILTAIRSLLSFWH